MLLGVARNLRLPFGDKTGVAGDYTKWLVKINERLTDGKLPLHLLASAVTYKGTVSGLPRLRKAYKANSYRSFPGNHPINASKSHSHLNHLLIYQIDDGLYCYQHGFTGFDG
jgi:hypothetical protein